MWTFRRSRPKPGWLVAPGTQASATPQPTDVEEESLEKNQRHFFLLAASAAAAISWSGTYFLFPPLHLVSVPITLAATLPIFQDTAVALRNREMDVAAVSAVAVIGSLLLQQTTVSALIGVIHYTGEATIEWWKKGEAAQTPRTKAKSIYADFDVYFVRCWREDRGDAQPIGIKLRIFVYAIGQNPVSEAQNRQNLVGMERNLASR